MDERRMRVLLLSVAVVMLGCTAAVLALRPTADSGEMPNDPRAIARRLAAHPSDWRAASAMTEHALDAPVADRFALWRAAHDAAMHLAPEREAPRAAFARSAFFHWNELSPADRAAALDAFAPLLHNDPAFADMARPLFELTGDLAMLRRAQPGTVNSLYLLQSIAGTYGRFDDYRVLRDELRAKWRSDFFAKLHRVAPAEIIGSLPPPPYRADDQPLLVAALDELHRRPLDSDPHRGDVVPGLIDYVVRHHLRPLYGIDVIDRSPDSASELDRLRLSREMGKERDSIDIRMSATAPLREPPANQWQGVDGELAFAQRAWIDRDMHGVATIAVKNVQSDEVPPYVEIYFDDALISEGAVDDTRLFALPPARGPHRIEVNVGNPRTRNSRWRRVRIVSVAP